MDKTLNEKLAALRAELELDEAATPNAYRIGTVRTWKSGKVKKTATGWVPVTALLKKVANTPKGATASQDLKHTTLGKIVHTKKETGGTKDMPHFGGTMPHRYENGECVYCGAEKPDNEAIEPENTTYGGFRRLAGLVDDRVLGENEPPSAATKYADNPDAYNTALAKLMQQLKRDKNLGVTGVRQGYKGTGSQAHKRQVWVKVPSHERGGPDVWLEGGYVRVGGIVNIPKDIPSSKKYDDESPEQVYNWIADTLRKLKAHIDAKYANSPTVKGESVANMGDDDVVKTARALASKAHKGKLSPKETKDFKMAMQRIKDEGLLSDDDQKDIWQWHGGGGQ